MRFSLLALIALTTFAGLACAALAQPSAHWLTIVVTSTALLFSWQVLQLLMADEARRAPAAGWLLFACVYLGLVFGPWTQQRIAPSLLTSQALRAAERKWFPETVAYQIDLSYSPSQLVSGRININTLPTTDYSQLVSYLSAGMPAQFSAPASLFHLTGHWLFAWLAGWLGALVAAAFYRRAADRRRSLTSG
jgi:hypothetical protein